jgi:hypothetical protein
VYKQYRECCPTPGSAWQLAGGFSHYYLGSMYPTITTGAQCRHPAHTSAQPERVNCIIMWQTRVCIQGC